MSHPFDPPVPPPGSYGSVPSPPGSVPGVPPPPPPPPPPGGYTLPLPAGAPSPATEAFPTMPVPVPGAPLGGGATVADVLEIGRSPVSRAVLAVAVAVVAAVLAVGTFALEGPVGWAGLAWFLSGPVAIGLLAWYTITDTRRRACPIYDRIPLGEILYWIAVVVAGVGIGFSAWTIADWVARQ